MSTTLEKLQYDASVVKTYIEKDGTTFPVLLGIKIVFEDGVVVSVKNPYTKEVKKYLGQGTTVFYSFRHKTISVTPKAYAPLDPNCGNGTVKTDENYKPLFIVPEKTSCSIKEFGRVYGKKFARLVAQIIVSFAKG